jgi:lysophospholipid acyltransferase 5
LKMGTWTKDAAESLGGSEAGLKLILGQLAGYPLLLFYRKFLSDKDPKLQHVYFTLSGLFLGHWVIGPGVANSIYAIIFTYLLLKLAGGSLVSVVVSFSFHLSYLLVGYWYNNTGDEYDISWTMPQCVLCLRLIGLTIDIYDGAQLKLQPANLSKDQLKNCLVECPDILEMLSHSFFIGGYFVGPQFSMRKFKEFATPAYHQNLPASPSRFGFRRLMIGVAYLAGHLVGNMYIPEEWPNSQLYTDASLPTKLFCLLLWVKIILAKYISIWLMAEGVCVVSGLSYNGVYEDGSPCWTGCANVKLRRLETATQFGHYIEAFNINTNGWVATYVYKRLKFMNNRNISQVTTLVFLALWHGWHPGYYLTFFNEFICMGFEAEWSKVWARSKKVQLWKLHPAYQTVTSIIGWCYVHFFLPHCFIPFPLKTAPRIFAAYRSVYFVHFLFYLGWPAWGAPLRSFLKPSSDKPEFTKPNKPEIAKPDTGNKSDTAAKSD